MTTFLESLALLWLTAVGGTGFVHIVNTSLYSVTFSPSLFLRGLFTASLNLYSFVGSMSTTALRVCLLSMATLSKLAPSADFIRVWLS